MIFLLCTQIHVLIIRVIMMLCDLSIEQPNVNYISTFTFQCTLNQFTKEYVEFVNSILYQIVVFNDHSTSLFRQLTVTNTVGCPSRSYDPTLE